MKNDLISREAAEEFTQTLEQFGSTFWRQILLADKLGVPGALGLTLKEWTNERIGGSIKLSIEERLEAVKEMRAEGLSQRKIAAVLGVDRTTVTKDLRSGGNSPPPNGAMIKSGENSPPEREISEREVIIAEIELSQESANGITEREASQRVNKAYARMVKDQNERACRYLARRMVMRLFVTYEGLADEVARTLSE
jgi:predicted transcriptional regulator